MDVASLIVRAGYDGTEVTTGLTKNAQDVQKFGQAISGALGPLEQIKLPRPADDTTAGIDRALAALKALGVQVKELQRETSGVRVFETLAKDANAVTGVFDKLGVSARVVTTEMTAANQELAKADAQLRERITLLAEGARFTNTQAASAKELRGVYTSLSRELAQANIPLERRIQLERELVRIRGTFSVVDRAATRTPASDFIAAATPVQRTADALRNASRAADGTTRSFALINRETGEFTSLGRRASGAAIGFAFGLEALARGGTAADGGLRTALRTTASFAAFFGPKGLIVSGAAAATAAILDLFNKSRDEMAKTVQAFEEDMATMVRNADILGLLRKMQEINVGDPSKGPGLVGFKDGLADLTERLRLVEEAQQKAFDAGNFLAGVTAQGREARELREKIAPLRKEYEDLEKVVRNFPQLPRLASLATPIQVTGKTDAALADEAFKRLTGNVDTAIAAFKQLAEVQKDLRPITGTLVDLHRQATAALGAERDKTSANAVALRDLIAKLEEVGEVQAALRRAKFNVGDIFGALGVIQVPEIPPDQIRQLEDDLARNLAGVGPAIRAVFGKSIGDAIATALRAQVQGKLSIPVELQPTLSTVNLRGFEAAAERLRDAQRLLDFSELTGDPSFQAEATKRVEEAQRRVQQYAKVVQTAMKQANIPLEEQKRILAEIERIMKGLNAGADAASSLADSMHQITAAGRGVLSTARNLGVLTDEAERALEAVLQLVDGMALLKAPDLLSKFGGVLSIIGGVGTILQSLGVIGETPAQKEANRILRANTEELARLRLELSGFTKSVGQQLALSSQVRLLAPHVDRLARARPDIDFFGRIDMGPVFRAIDNLFTQMAALGLNMEDLAAIADQVGVDILDSEGRLIPGAMAQFAERLRLGAEAALKFTDSLEDRRTQLDILNRARGLPDTAQQAIEDSARLFEQMAPDLFRQFFGNVDLSDVGASRQAILAFLEAWFAEVLDPALFEGFADKSEVIAIISAWLDGIDRMTEAADRATEAMVNIPAGFKIDRARFNATLAEIGNALAGSVDELDTSKKSKKAARAMTVVHNETFHVNVVGAQKSMRQLFDEISVEAKRRSRAISPTVGAAAAFDQ